MKEQIREQALSLGFDACGFARALPAPNTEAYDRWLEGGLHGGMEYLARGRDKRANPELILPGVKSVVVLAASYATASGAPPRSLTGVVARYAQYADYHEILGAKLRELTAWLDRESGAASRALWYVDTGAILERGYAQAAGLGFAGKHTNLISRKLGNWIFLGEILTTLDLEADTPERNHCGSCTRCLKACPTGALPEPFRLDARRCISYLTIELKGAIPEELRPLIGTRIYGCDDCLAACPWNRFAQEGRIMREHARQDLRAPALLELLSLDGDGFKKRFEGTPIMRAKRKGLLRNVCVALGNLRDPETIPSLRAAAADAEPLIAEHARWALNQIEERPTSPA